VHHCSAGESATKKKPGWVSPQRHSTSAFQAEAECEDAQHLLASRLLQSNPSTPPLSPPVIPENKDLAEVTPAMIFAIPYGSQNIPEQKFLLFS